MPFTVNQGMLVLPELGPMPLPLEPPPVAVRGLERELLITSVAGAIDQSAEFPESVRADLLSYLKSWFFSGGGTVCLVPMLPVDAPEPAAPVLGYRKILRWYMKRVGDFTGSLFLPNGTHDCEPPPPGLTMAEWQEVELAAAEITRDELLRLTGEERR